ADSTEYAGSKLLNGTFGVTASSGGTFTASIGYAGVTGLESGVTYTVTSTASGAGEVDITISATLGSGRVSETIYDVSTPATNETKEVKFNALGLTLTLNNNLDEDSDGTIIANSATASNFQVGPKNTDNDRIGILLQSVKGTDSNGLNLTKDKLDTASEAQDFLTTIDTAISTLNTRRGNVGAAQNRLEYAAANLATTIENVQSAESVIRDVDMAAEMTTFTKNQILLQAGTAMLAQANMAPQQVLALFG
ncbi:MAG: flagellar protein, partial [Deltaproteobacteria bacterium]|nr:flagellar protein [Deltaproteobacteria bacterium]